MKIGLGIIGCGTIADVYLKNLTEKYRNVEVLAVSDIYFEKAQEAAKKYHVLKACTSEELLADPDIKIVLNLTIPAVHYSINKKILEAGKYVYCEKPLALKFSEAVELNEIAKSKGLMCVSAPDTFLGAGLQQCRAILEQNKIGKSFGFTANMTCAGHELWHPNPGFYYKTGGGPLFDMGPYYLTALVYLLGPIKAITCLSKAGRPIRNIKGIPTRTEIDTTYCALVEFHCGAIGTLMMSFDTWKTNLPLLEIYCTEGSLFCPDPNNFGGPVHIYRGERIRSIIDACNEPHPAKLFTMIDNMDKCIEEVPMAFPDTNENMRGLGVSDMAQAIIDNRPARLSGELSVHVVEALEAFTKSSNSLRRCELTTDVHQTEMMDSGWKLWEIN